MLDRLKIFESKELDVPRLLACTCLTLLMQAVEVDGEFYWDGSYSGNLAIFPLVYNCDARDILMVHIPRSSVRAYQLRRPRS